MARTKSDSTPSGQVSSATIGFEAKWPDRKVLTADKLRNNMDAAVKAKMGQLFGGGI